MGEYSSGEPWTTTGGVAMTEPTTLEEFRGVGDVLADRLREVGIETPADVADAPVQRLTAVEGLSARLARSLKTQAGRPARESARTLGATIRPSDWTITESQAAHVESLGLADGDEIVDAVADDLRDRLEPFDRFHLPFFRRVCGRVVAPDPATGELRPVPNATVTVYDTDCSFFGYFPSSSPFCWFYPFGRHRERIARTRTDECGRFCVSVPWWDVDRVVRYRLERICLRDVVRPRVVDLLDPDDVPEVTPIPIPDPEPDPVSERLRSRRGGRRRRSTGSEGTPSLSLDLDSPGRLSYLEGLVGRTDATELLTATDEQSFGGRRTRLDDLLRRPAFVDPTPPPLPDDLLGANDWTEVEEYEFDVDPSVLDQIDPGEYLGPFLRCHYVRIPTWETVYDVPDITFEVTQDTDSDGTEEPIYSEGYFEVRWDDVPNEVELVADPTARTVASCRTPDPELFVCTDPSIVSAEDMALRGPYHEDDGTVTSPPAGGYQRLVNRPRTAPSDGSTGSRLGTGEAPYAGVLQLHGCSRVGDATHYRVVYRHKPDVDVPDWSATQPFTGLDWEIPVLFDADPYPVEPGANGWYENLSVQAIEDHYGQTFTADEPQDLVVFPYLLLQWPSHRYPNGRYDLRVQVGVEDGSGGMTVTDQSEWLPMVVDNTRPTARIQSLEWWYDSETDAAARDLLATDTAGDPTCPVIRRRTEAVHVRVGYHVSTPHLRDLRLRILGCSPPEGPSAPNPSIDTATPPTSNGPRASDTVHHYWHTHVDADTRTGSVTFTVDATDPDGAYTVALDAYSRAYNPGSHPMNPDWDGDGTPRHVHPRQGIAIVTT